MIAAMVFTGFASCARPGNEAVSSDGTQVARIGSYSISAAQVDELTRQQLEQVGGYGAGSPELEASFMAGVVGQLVEQGYVMQLAERRGVKVDDARISRMLDAQLDEEVVGFRRQLEQSGTLQAGATDEEFQKVFKEQVGTDLASVRQRQNEQLQEVMRDPARKANLVAAFSRQALLEDTAESMRPTDDQLKQGFDQLTYKRVLIREASGSKSQDEIARDALEEIRGGMEFERAMERYSQEPPAPGKKVSESTVVYARSDLGNMPGLASLEGLQPGQVGEVVTTLEGAAVYKLISMKDNVPQDFEAQKEDYRKAFAQSGAMQKLQSDLDAVRSEMPVEWKSRGYKALYDYYQITSRPDSTKDRGAALAAIEQEAQEAYGEPIGQKAAVFARLLAFQGRYTSASPEQREQLRDSQIEVLSAVMEVTESVSTRIDLAELYAEKRQGDDVYLQLLAAARANGRLDEQGQQLHGQIASNIDKYKASNLLDSNQAKEIEDVLERWRRDKAEQEESRRRFEEEAKKAEQDAAAQQGTTPAPQSRREAEGGSPQGR
jgi:hypothetical protein